MLFPYNKQYLHSLYPSWLTGHIQCVHLSCTSSFLHALRLAPVYSLDPTAPLFKNAWTIKRDAHSLCLSALPPLFHQSVHLLMFVQSSFSLLKEMEIPCSDLTKVTNWYPFGQHLQFFGYKVGTPYPMGDWAWCFLKGWTDPSDFEDGAHIDT